MSATLLQRDPRRWPEAASASEAAMRSSFCALPTPAGHGVADHQHLQMVHAYRRAGGLVSSDEVALRLRRHTAQPISVLARWIVARNVVSFVWQSQTLLPLFQFDLSDMSLRGGATEVVEELSGAFDDWELATWFARPNSWLRYAAPVDMMDADQPAVLQAARADRYIARG
jgi:hypothetical protein